MRLYIPRRSGGVPERSGRGDGQAVARGCGGRVGRATRLLPPARRRDGRRGSRAQHGPRFLELRREAGGARRLGTAGTDPRRCGLDARLDRRRRQRPAVGHCPAAGRPVDGRGHLRRAGARGRARAGARWCGRAGSSGAGRQDDGRRAGAGGAHAEGTARCRRERGRGARGRPRGGGGGDALDGSTPGEEGPRLLSRRAEHRPPGSGRDVDGAHPRCARARGRSGAVMERELHGVAVAAGVAAGPTFVLAEPVAAPEEGGASAALAALARVSAELARTEERLAAQGRAAEAEIIGANRLMAEDPSLVRDVEVLATALPPAEALRTVTERRANALASLDDALLAARAADVRELGRRAVRALSGGGAAESPSRPSIVVARELGPAEVVDLRLDEGLVLGIALAEGSATSHAAIIAPSHRVPMVAALGNDVLAVRIGDELIVDGTTGTAMVHPGRPALARIRAAAAANAAERLRLAAGRGEPCVTAAGRPIRLLANASSPAEVDAALERGAEGVGLVRTELAFLDSTSWPTEAEHYNALAPLLARLEGRITTVRTLDFGADKTPSFLRGDGGRGIALMLEHEDALVAQLTAILRAGAATQLRIMLPLVESPAQLVAGRRLLLLAGGDRVQLGAMVETPAGALRSTELALAADFFSIGTNDLVATTLGLDRERPAPSPPPPA